MVEREGQPAAAPASGSREAGHAPAVHAAAGDRALDAGLQPGGEDGASGEETEGEGEGESEVGEEGEEEEPRLKYQRMGASVAELVKTDTARCLAVHPRFLVLGTGSGLLLVLDFNGNEVQRFTPHSAAVNDICVDAAGEYVGSCSEDGTVAVQSLYDPSEASTHWHGSAVKALALAPEFSRGRRVFACGGLGGQLVLSSRGWFGLKDEVLHAGEGPVRCIKWHGPLLAWANDAGVKLYDSHAQTRLGHVERPAHAPAAEALGPHLVWASLTCLLIGWADTIKIGVVRTRPALPPQPSALGVPLPPLPAGVGGAAPPARYIEIVSLVQMDGYICGLAPVRLPPIPRADADGAGGAACRAQPSGLLLAVLVYSCESNDELGFASGASAAGHAERPELRLVSPDGEELSSDALSVNRFEAHRAASYALAQQPPPYEPEAGQGGGGLGGLGGGGPGLGALGLGALAGEPAGAGADERCGEPAAQLAAAREPLFYVLSPFDLIVSRARDAHDHLRWLLERGEYDRAVGLARARPELFGGPELAEAAEAYVRHLLGLGQARKAALAAAEHFGPDSALWRRWLAEFERAGGLAECARALPSRAPRLLRPAVYEHALLRLLDQAPLEFASLLLAWPSSLYRGAEVVLPALLAHLRRRVGLPPLPPSSAEGAGADAAAEETGAAAAAAVAASRECANADDEAAAAALPPPEASELGALTASLARLHAACGRLDAALRLWLALRSPRALAFLVEHSMVGAVRLRVAELVELDSGGAIELLAAHQHAVPARDVLRQLHGRERLQHAYLHALFLKDTHAGAPFADLQVRLYARYEPGQLLRFLRASSSYALQPALRVCEAGGLVREQVHILARVGDSKAALQAILGRLGDVPLALQFAREQREPELSAELLSRSLASPQLAAQLLEHLAGHNDVLQPTDLLRRLPEGASIPGLLAKVARILADYRQQRQLASSCAQIIEQDARELALRLFRARRVALRLG